MSPAQQVLKRLLERAEGARLRGDASPVSLSLTGKRDGTEYMALGTLAEQETFHAEIRLAERIGAIQVERERHRADGEQLLRIRVASLEALASHLGVELLEQRMQQVERLLAPWRARFAAIDAVLDTWRQKRKVRTHGPEAAQDLADAARVVAASDDERRRERILRRESIRLFGDSKRLEALTTWLELLMSGQLVAEGVWDKHHVWAALGLRREPQPLLMAGRATLHLQDGSLPLLRPWLGLPVESLQRVETQARCVLSIENLASFHDAAHLKAPDTLLLYTGGMPSPAWRRAYLLVLRALPADARVYHWGDIDEGGFRIASVLAQAAREAGHQLLPWQMSPTDLPAAIHASANNAKPATLKAMCHWAERAGWPEIAQALRELPLTLEQELLEAMTPKPV